MAQFSWFLVFPLNFETITIKIFYFGKFLVNLFALAKMYKLLDISHWFITNVTDKT